MPSMSETRNRPFEWWWMAIGAAAGAGAGVGFPAVGIPIGTGLGMVGGLAVALLRKSREWSRPKETRPHYHERPKGEAGRHHGGHH